MDDDVGVDAKEGTSWDSETCGVPLLLLLLSRPEAGGADNNNKRRGSNKGYRGLSISVGSSRY
jgi:hypothetical protein